MADKIKGFLVTLDGGLSEDDSRCVEHALRMTKYVIDVTPYVKRAEDHMLEKKGRMDLAEELFDFLQKSVGMGRK